MPVIDMIPGRSVAVAATASSVGGAIDCTGCDRLYIANTSTTVSVAVRFGVGAQTAVLTTDLMIPPMSYIVAGCNPTVTHVAAIGTAAGPTTVQFSPMPRGRD